MNWIKKFEKLDETLVVIVGAALIVALGALDHFVYPDIPFSVFYWLPIAFVVWFASMRYGVAAAAFSALVWTITDSKAQSLFAAPALLLGGVFIRLASFLAIAFLLALLKRSRANYQNLFQNIPDGIFRSTPDGRILAANPALVRMLGYESEEEVTRLVFTPDLYLDQAERNRAIDLLKEQGTVRNFEITLKRRDGTPRIFLDNVVAVRDTSDGALYYEGILTDITERKEMEEALHRSESELRALFAGMRDVALVMDRDGVYRRIAPTDPGLLYKAPEELLGKRLPDVFPPQEADQYLAAVRETLATRKLQRIEYPLEIRGNTHWFSAHLTPMSEDLVVWVARDITEQKRREEKIQRQFQQLSALRNIDLAIGSSFDLKVTLNILLTSVAKQLNVDAAAVLLLDKERQEFELSTSLGFRSAAASLRIQLGQGVLGRAALERRAISIPDIRKAATGIEIAGWIREEGFAALYVVPLISKGKLRGILGAFHRSPLNPDSEWLDFLNALGGQAAIAIEDAQLFENLQRSNIELRQAYDRTIEGWSRALDLRDKETEGHTLRVTELTLRLARAIGLSDEEMIHVRRGALLHDMGKLGVPDQILFKGDALSEEEWERMRMHPRLAYEMLSPIEFLRPALDIPYCHHEKWDGTGYPRGLKGEQIPLTARMFAVVDVWDALTSDRPYRPAWTKEKALEYIREQSGKHFDPIVAQMFIEIIKKEICSSPPRGEEDISDSGFY